MQNFIKKTNIIQTTASGSEIVVYSYHYANNPGGNCYYVQAGIHGVELIGTPVIYEFMNYVTQNQLKLNLVCVPIANPFGTDSQIMGLQTGYNNIHTNEQNCHNYNRLGQGIGEDFEDAMIKNLYELSKDCDVIIDLHCAAYETKPHIYCPEQYLEDAKMFGIEYIMQRKDAGKSFEDTNYSLGKKSFTLELGPSRMITKDFVERGLGYLQNYFIPKEHDIDYIISNSSDIKKFFVSDAGFLVRNIEVGESFLAGDVVADIYTTEGKKEVIVDYDGIFLLKKPIHAPYKGQEIAQFIKK